MYDYLREIPLSYREEYNNLVVNNSDIKDSVKYQLVILSYKEENCIGDYFLKKLQVQLWQQNMVWILHYIGGIIL